MLSAGPVRRCTARLVRQCSPCRRPGFVIRPEKDRSISRACRNLRAPYPLDHAVGPSRPNCKSGLLPCRHTLGVRNDDTSSDEVSQTTWRSDSGQTQPVRCDKSPGDGGPPPSCASLRGRDETGKHVVPFCFWLCSTLARNGGGAPSPGPALRHLNLYSRYSSM